MSPKAPSMRSALPLALSLALSLTAALFFFGCGGSESTTEGPLDASVDDSKPSTDSSVDTATDSGGQDANQDATTDTGKQDAAIDSSALDSAFLDASPQDASLDGAFTVADPAKEGPYTYKVIDSTLGLLGMGVHCAIPEVGPSKGPYPIILFAHGFMLETFRYNDYASRLASFGHVACLVGYSSLQGQDSDPGSISEVLDWAIAESAKSGSALSGKVDASHAGVMGHSRGGKAAVNAASADARFVAVLGLDPVNTCPMGTCPDAIVAMAKLKIPSGFVGETTDNGAATDGGGQPCAPAQDNFEKFYAAAPSTSFKVNISGANHMSFLNNTTACLQCSVCLAATTDSSVVLDIAFAYSVAFFERNLRGNTGYDTYLTGAIAKQRYVQTSLATIDSK